MTTEMVIEELIYENCSTNNSTTIENAAKLVCVEKMEHINHDLHNLKI